MDKIEDETLTPLEEAFLKGFMDCSAPTARNNPYEPGSPEHEEYHRGYTRSLAEID